MMPKSLAFCKSGFVIVCRRMDQVLKSLENENIEELGNSLKAGAIAVIPTDTQYGIVTSALKEESVHKIYSLRKRSPEKPMIILISNLDQLQNLGLQLTPYHMEIMQKYWPNPISIIIPVPNNTLEYLHRGKNSLAFRMPNNTWLQNLLNISGPLVAPSANWEDEKPASTIIEAKKYFGDQIETYIDNGEMNNPPSTIIRLTDSGFEIVRQGVFQLSK